jgi:hypothetical protein
MADKDRPGGMLEISPALERDMDKAAAGKIPAPPIEAFMSDAALQDAQDATTAAAGPVHAQDLRPISRAEAAARSTFDGTALPGHGRQRRVIPAPYRRDRIRGAVHHGKAWVTVRADYVREGDIVPGTGLVVDVLLVTRRETVAGRPDIPVGTDVILRGIGGVETILDSSSEVRAFRPPAPGS